MEVVAEKDVMVQFNRLLMHMKRVTKDTFTDRDDLGPWLKKGEALQAARDDVMCRPLGRLIAEMVRHKETPVDKEGSLFSLAIYDLVLRDLRQIPYKALIYIKIFLINQLQLTASYSPSYSATRPATRLLPSPAQPATQPYPAKT